MKKIISLVCLSVFLVACDTADEENTPIQENAETELEKTPSLDTTEPSETKLEEDKAKHQAQFVQEAFKTFLNFTNENYEDKMAQTQTYFTNKTISNMIGSIHLDTEMTFEQISDNEEIYKSLQNDTQFIYKAEISFQVEENPKTIITNFYNFDLIEDNNSGEYKIDNVEVTVQQPPL